MPNIIQENAHFLDNDPLWAALSAEERQTVQKESTIVRYGKNEQIYREEDIPEAVMLLVSGKVRIYKEGIGQRPQIIRMLKPNELFAYRAVIAGDGFNTSASAFEDSVVYRLPKDTFLRIIRNNSEFCFRMMVIMAKNLAFSELQTVNLTQKHIRGRLAESLLTLKNKYGVDDDGVTISMYMSREDLANLSNMTTSNAIRTLSQFASEGIVGIDGRKIKLLNEPALTRISRLG